MSRERVAAVVNVLCAIALIVFALILLGSWFNDADAAVKRPGHGCRNATHCTRPIPTTPALPTIVPCPNLCTPTDLTTGAVPLPPLETVQTFPSPLYP